LQKLRTFIFARWPQPFCAAVFQQDITGTPGGSKNEVSLGNSRAGQLQLTGRDGGVMASMKGLMLGLAIMAGAAGLGATTANAAQFGIYIGGGPAAYVPPCPGPGYTWIAGYYDRGYWVPGRWNFVGRYDRDDFYRHRDWDRDRYYDRGRIYDRDDHRRDWDRDHDRFRR
jgi:hypothetical protein